MILLHAFPLNGKTWAPQMEALAETRRVIAPDYPGFGSSSLPHAQPDLHYYAERVLELLNRPGLERVVLGGLSMGGYAVFACLKLFAERMSALILAGARAGPDTEESKKTRQETIRRVVEEGIEVLLRQQLEDLVAPDTPRNGKDVVEAVRGTILESSPEGAIAALGAMRERPGSTEPLGKIDVPTLVVSGGEGGIFPPEIVEEMAGTIPGSSHLTLPKAGHLSNPEASEEFNAAVKDFLATI